MSTDLLKSISVDNMLQQRNAARDRMALAHRALQEVLEIETAALGPHHYSGLLLECCLDRSKRFTDADGLPYFLRRHDAVLWDKLLTETGLRTFMDAEARKTWDDGIAKTDVPEFTRENINATFAHLYEDRQTMFERGVVALFKHLSWEYKTNAPVKFGKRFVDRSVVWMMGKSHGGINYEAANRLDDLLRVLQVLDGKPEVDSRQGAFHALNDSGWPIKVQEVQVQDLIRIRGFKNGNAHVTFLRPDLTDQLNLIIAKHYPHALPPAA